MCGLMCLIKVIWKLFFSFLLNYAPVIGNTPPSGPGIAGIARLACSILIIKVSLLCRGIAGFVGRESIPYMAMKICIYFGKALIKRLHYGAYTEALERDSQGCGDANDSCIRCRPFLSHLLFNVLKISENRLTVEN